MSSNPSSPVAEQEEPTLQPDASAPSPTRKKKCGKGKQKKHYVDNTSELLSLAALASGTEETGAMAKIAKAKARLPKPKNPVEPKPAKKAKVAKSSQIEKLKADIVAKTSDKRAKKRKAAKTNAASTRDQKKGGKAVEPAPRKGVSFA